MAFKKGKDNPIGKKHSEETKRKIRENKHNQSGINNPMYGRKGKDNPTFGKPRKDVSELNKRRWKEGKIILPKKDTSIEVKIQCFLKELGIEFFTHQYMNIEHGYQCDILIPSMNLIIECDGNYWHNYPFGRNIDKIRTLELLERGFKILRLWETEIRNMNVTSFKDILNNNSK